MASTAGLIATQTTVHRVLSTPELQDQIFGFNGDEDAARCALVCKAWTEVALGHAWHTLGDFQPLLKILAPVSKYKNAEGTMLLRFDQKIKSANRARFLSYASRVKVVGIDSDALCPSKSAFIEILRSSQGGSLLPNLKTMHIEVDKKTRLLKLAALCLHPRLSEIYISCQAVSGWEAEVQDFFDDIAIWSSGLRLLGISIEPEQPRKCSASISQMLLSQKLLNTLFVSPGLASSSVLGAVSHLPHLSQVTIATDAFLDSAYRPGIKDDTPCGPTHGEDCFPSMQFLDVRSGLSNATQFLSTHPHFVRLTKLAIFVVAGYRSIDVRRCLEVISKTSKNLQNLEITHLLADHSDDCEPLSKDDLSPVAKLRELETFSITHAKSVALTNADLIDLLSSDQALLKLSISTCQHAGSSATASRPLLDVLHRIADIQPGLESLSLRFDALDTDSLPCFLDDSVSPFDDLKTLDVADSRIVDADRTALYLSQILPPRCIIKHSGGEYGTLWDSVKGRIPLFQRVVSEHRRHVEDLETTHEKLVEELNDENESLKAKIKSSSIVTEGKTS